MSTLVADIYAFNEKADLLGKGMDSFVETAYILEEAMEGFEPVFNGAREDGTPVEPGDKEWITARHWSLSLMNQIHQAVNQRNLPMPSEVAELDKAIDGVVFNIGKMAKMGLSVEQIEEAFGIVSGANMAKINGPKDEHGKQLKPEGWGGPEAALQGVLDKRANPQPTLLDEES